MTNKYLEICIIALKKINSDESLVILPSSKIIEDLGLESIDFVDFIFELERGANIQIEITELSIALSHQSGRRFREVTVQEIADYLQKLCEK